MELIIITIVATLAGALLIASMFKTKRGEKSVLDTSRSIINKGAQNIESGMSQTAVLNELEFLQDLEDMGFTDKESVVGSRVKYQEILATPVKATKGAE